MNSMRTLARTLSLRTSSGSRLAADNACSGLYCVHGGGPMRNIGCSSLNFFLALVRISSSSKFHARPSVSHVVRSRANPANTSELGNILIVLVILGAL